MQTICGQRIIYTNYHYPFVRMSSGLEVASRARVISKQKQEVESTWQESEIVAVDALMMIAKAVS